MAAPTARGMDGWDDDMAPFTVDAALPPAEVTPEATDPPAPVAAVAMDPPAAVIDRKSVV